MHADAALPILAEVVVGDLLVVLDGLVQVLVYLSSITLSSLQRWTGSRLVADVLVEARVER